MSDPYLEITFRHGQPLAAYYYLLHQGERKSHRSKRMAHGLVIDFDESGAPIGIEITSPRSLTLQAFNEVLVGLGCRPVGQEELSPLMDA